MSQYGVRYLQFIFSVILLAAILGLLRSSYHQQPNRLETIDAIKRVARFEKIVVLTFDDGPNEPYTSLLLDLLKAEGVKAVFFVVGKNVERLPQVARRIVDEGHVIANHSYSHFLLTKLSPQDILWEITEGEQAIESATGVKPYLFRFPYGAMNSSIAKSISRQGYSIVGWSSHGYDWVIPRSPKKIAKDVLKRIRPGTIILLHDGAGTNVRANTLQTVEATKLILHELKKRGYRTATFPNQPNS